MARLIAVVFVTAVSLASAAYLAFFTTNNPIWFAAALAVGAVAAYQSIALFRDRFVPDPQFKAQPRQSADEKMYLEGQGIRVIRFSNGEVLQHMDAVRERIGETLQELAER